MYFVPTDNPPTITVVDMTYDPSCITYVWETNQFFLGGKGMTTTFYGLMGMMDPTDFSLKWTHEFLAQGGNFFGVNIKFLFYLKGTTNNYLFGSDDAETLIVGATPTRAVPILRFAVTRFTMDSTNQNVVAIDSFYIT